jgi:hypothetical protein
MRVGEHGFLFVSECGIFWACPRATVYWPGFGRNDGVCGPGAEKATATTKANTGILRFALG